MAKKQHNDVVVGLTVLAVLVLTIYIVVVLGDWQNLFRDKKKITIEQPYTIGLKGLSAGSPVLLGGAKIGQITETDIVYDKEADQVKVFFTLEIPEEYPLRQDCLLSPLSNVLGGQASLDIKSLGEKKEIIGDGEVVQEVKFETSIADAIESLKNELDSQAAGSLLYNLKEQVDKENPDSILASLVTTAINLRDTTNEINKQIEPNEEGRTLMFKVHEILDKLDTISLRFRDQLELKPGEDKATMMAKIHTALDALNSSLEQIDELIRENSPGITETIDSLKVSARKVEESLPGIIDDANEILATAKEAMGSARDALGKVEEILSVNRESIDRMVRNLDEVSVNLKMTSREVRLAPWKLLYQPGKDELQLQGVIDAASGFANGAERLDEATVRLKALLGSTGEEIDPKRIESILAELETSFERFQKAENKLWEELK